MATNSTTVGSRGGPERATVFLIGGILLIVLGTIFELGGLALYLLQESAFDQAQEQAERAGLDEIPGVSRPDIFVIVGPLLFAAPIIAIGVMLILLWRDSGRQRSRLL